MDEVLSADRAGYELVCCAQRIVAMIRDEWLEASEERVGIGRKQHHRSARHPPSQACKVENEGAIMNFLLWNRIEKERPKD